jgi:Ca-activated chloride channel family protein
MLDSRIDITVRGPVVETVIVQRFRNPSDRATEATYIFPLPADAAVSAMAMQIGSRTIRAKIERRDAAQRRYEAAVAAGVAAALLEQERPDVFTQTVSAVPAHGIVEVSLRYDALARYEAGLWELVVPMVVAPRYVPGPATGRATTGSGRAADTDRAPDASRVTPAAAPGVGGSTAITIHFVDEPSELASPTHELGGTRRDATLSDPHSDHDAIVRWRAPAASAGWIERDGAGGFAAVVVEAPPPVPRTGNLRVILAIDRAATTRGDADTVEHPLVRALLGALASADRVRVIGSETIAWNPPSDVLAALDRRWATPPRPFDLTRVLADARPEGVAIVLVSDGLVADDPAAIAAAARLGVPVHVIGIGPAPARATLRQIAAATGGTVRFAVTGDDLAVIARCLVADLANPSAPLTINWGTLAAADLEPAVLPRLGAGQAMLVLARIKDPRAANARARGDVFAFEALGPARAVDGATTSHGPLARRWARERLSDLLARTPDRNAVTSHALGYGLVSPYTSLVAIGSDVIVQGGVTRSIAVPVSLPSGMQWHAVKQASELDTGSTTTPVTVEPTQPPVVAQAPAETPPPKVVAPSPVPPPTRSAEPPWPAKESKKPRPKAVASDDDSGDASERPSEELDARGEVIRIEGQAPSITKQSLTNGATVIDGKDLNSVAGESVEVVGSARAGGPRLSAALGAGLTFDHGARGLLALDVRLETAGRTRFGVDAALWLAGGSELSGRALVTASRSALARRLELGLGAGARLGNGAGIAGSLQLRVNTPLPWLAGVLRYDAALVLTRPNLELEQATTLGVELSY